MSDHARPTVSSTSPVPGRPHYCRTELKALADRNNLKFKYETHYDESTHVWWASHELVNPDGSSVARLGSNSGTTKNVATEHSALQSRVTLSGLITLFSGNGTGAGGRSGEKHIIKENIAKRPSSIEREGGSEIIGVPRYKRRKTEATVQHMEDWDQDERMSTEGSETTSPPLEREDNRLMLDRDQLEAFPIPGVAHEMKRGNDAQNTGLVQTRSPGRVGQFKTLLIKPLMRFLTMPYLRAKRILQLAHSVHVFHMQSIYLARQALHLVILLNDLVDTVNGPDDEQYEERNDLEDELIDLFDAMKIWGANRDDMEHVSYEQQILEIKQWYTRLFRERFYFHNARDPSDDPVYQRLLAYDDRTIQFRTWNQDSVQKWTESDIDRPSVQIERTDGTSAVSTLITSRVGDSDEANVGNSPGALKAIPSSSHTKPFEVQVSSERDSEPSLGEANVGTMDNSIDDFELDLSDFDLQAFIDDQGQHQGDNARQGQYEFSYTQIPAQNRGPGYYGYPQAPDMSSNKDVSNNLPLVSSPDSLVSLKQRNMPLQTGPGQQNMKQGSYQGDGGPTSGQPTLSDQLKEQLAGQIKLQQLQQLQNQILQQQIQLLTAGAQGPSSTEFRQLLTPPASTKIGPASQSTEVSLNIPLLGMQHAANLPAPHLQPSRHLYQNAHFTPYSLAPASASLASVTTDLGTFWSPLTSPVLLPKVDSSRTPIIPTSELRLPSGSSPSNAGTSTTNFSADAILATPASLMNMSGPPILSSLDPATIERRRSPTRAYEHDVKASSRSAAMSKSATMATDVSSSLNSKARRHVSIASSARGTSGISHDDGPLSSAAGRDVKSTHKYADQKRRDLLKTTFNELRLLLPQVDIPATGLPVDSPSGEGDGRNKGISKLALLRSGNEFIQDLVGKVAQRDEEIGRLREELRRLRNMLGIVEADDVERDLEKKDKERRRVTQEGADEDEEMAEIPAPSNTSSIKHTAPLEPKGEERQEELGTIPLAADNDPLSEEDSGLNAVTQGFETLSHV